MSFYILKKRGEKHAVEEKTKETLCGLSIAKGERERKILYFTQCSCKTCRLAFADHPRRFKK